MTGTKKNCNYFTNNLHFTLQSDSYAINTDQLASLTLMKKSNSPNKNCTTGNLLLLCQYPIWMELLKVATLLFKIKWRSKDKLTFCECWGGGGGSAWPQLGYLDPRRILPAYTTYEGGTDSVPKRRQLKFRRRGIAQKKARNTPNTAKVWNQE
jgi:hypothetical protein